MTRAVLRPLDLDRLYAAVDDDDALQALPDVIAEACDGRSAMLLHDGRKHGASVPIMNYWPLAACVSYYEEHLGEDPWETMYREHFGADGVPAAIDDILPPQLFTRTTIYNELIRPLGDDTARCMGFALQRGVPRFQIGVHRAARDRPFGAAEIAALTIARDHVARAMRLRGLLAAERASRRQIEAMLDASDRAMLLLDGGLRIVRATPNAIAILDAGDGIACRNGRLLLASGAASSELLSLVRAVVSDRPGARMTLLCSRRSGAAAYRMRVLPAGRGVAGSALLLIDDPARTGSGIGSFAAAYGLTPAETALADGLLAGETLEEIASRRQVGRETVRTQLKAVFARTGTSRQSELIRLLATLPGD